jgi:hypothetical protein
MLSRGHTDESVTFRCGYLNSIYKEEEEFAAFADIIFT